MANPVSDRLFLRLVASERPEQPRPTLPLRPELLEFPDDAAFVRNAFLTMFGRTPEPPTLAAFVSLLRTNNSRVELIRALMDQQEYVMTRPPEMKESDRRVVGDLRFGSPRSIRSYLHERNTVVSQRQVLSARLELVADGLAVSPSAVHGRLAAPVLGRYAPRRLRRAVRRRWTGRLSNRLLVEILDELCAGRAS